MKIKWGMMMAAALGAGVAAADCEESFLDGVTEIRQVISAGEGSRIRVIAFLPDKAKWNGRLVMRGSGGGAGFIDFGCKYDALAGAIGCYCDLGTGRPWETEPREVITDLGHRATHASLLAVKKLAATFYGAAPKWCYFFGESTGGCQAFAEFERYPEDFDGVIAGVPAAARFPLHYYFAWVCKHWLKADGSEVFPHQYFTWMKEAALEYFADKDTPAARGKFLTDSRFTPERYAAIYALAAAKHSELKDADVAARLKAIYSGAMLSGRKVHAGLPFGTVPPDAASMVYFQFFHQWKFGKGKMPHELTDADFEALWADYGPDTDQLATDLSGLVKRGGKVLIYGGLADPIVPPFAVCDWYDQVVVRYGGLEKTREFLRFYLLPGRGHGAHGFGEKSTGVARIANQEALMFDWVEKGKAPPLVLTGLVPGGDDWPLKPYPDNFK